jgi:AcrR family transcriptional regulator
VNILAAARGFAYAWAMDSTETTETGWRGSRELWLQAAYEVLIREGVEGVKILPLARALKLSRTSFYWFFETREALLLALAEMWQARTTTPLCTAAQAYAETETEAMLTVIGCFLRPETFDAKLEFAMRGWGLTDAAILGRIEAADQQRLDALRAMLMRWGHSAQDADVRARAIYLVQIGYISMRQEESLDERVTRIPNYVEIYTGRAPEPREVARFRAGFGLESGA